jgi:integrase
MALRKAANVWIYQCKIGGRTWSRSTGKANRREAEREVPKLQRLAQLPRSQPSESLDLKEAICREVKRVEEDASRLEGLRVFHGLSNFLAFSGNVSLDRIDTALLDRYQRKRLGEASQRTVRMELCYVLRLLRLRGFQVVRPLPRRGRVTPQRAFTHDEIRRFFEACPPRYVTLYTLMPATGAREAELAPAKKWSHVPLLKSEVDLGRRLVTIRSAKAKPGTPVRSRVIPISEDLAGSLRTQWV